MHFTATQQAVMVVCLVVAIVCVYVTLALLLIAIASSVDPNDPDKE